MLTAEQNDELTQVAAGTPMGELLRRYWYPVAFTRALEEFPVQPARLLGEDFAVFKTPRGKYGLPAVTGTAFGTKTIKTGQRLRVDGNTGTVTVIDLSAG